MIDQITNPHVTKIREAPCKKRIKGRMSKDKRVMSEINNNIQKLVKKQVQKHNESVFCAVYLDIIKRDVQMPRMEPNNALSNVGI